MERGDEAKANVEKEIAETPGKLLKLLVARRLFKEMTRGRGFTYRWPLWFRILDSLLEPWRRYPRPYRRGRSGGKPAPGQEGSSPPEPNGGSGDGRPSSPRGRRQRVRARRPREVGALRRNWASRARQRQQIRRAIGARLAKGLIVLGEWIIGGEEGRLWGKEVGFDQAEAANIAIKVHRAFFNVFGALKIRWDNKTLPALRVRFALISLRVTEWLDIIAQHAALAGIILGGPPLAIAMVIGYVLGGWIGLWGTLITLAPWLSDKIEKWRRARLRTKKVAKNPPG
jgi:hypothetical protein